MFSDINMLFEVYADVILGKNLRSTNQRFHLGDPNYNQQTPIGRTETLFIRFRSPKNIAPNLNPLRRQISPKAFWDLANCDRNPVAICMKNSWVCHFGFGRQSIYHTPPKTYWIENAQMLPRRRNKMHRKPAEWLLRQHHWVPEISTDVIGMFCCW